MNWTWLQSDCVFLDLLLNIPCSCILTFLLFYDHGIFKITEI